MGADLVRLVLARDCMGIKPLLLAVDGDSIAFASELPALLKADVDHGGVNERVITYSFLLGYIPAPRRASPISGISSQGSG